MKYNAIIFDMDGTIIDTEGIWNHATLELLRRHNITLEKNILEEMLRSVQGLALPKSCLLIKETAKLSETTEELIREKSTIAHELYQKGIRFIPGFEQFHSALCNHKLKSGIATNATEETAQLTDNILNLRRFFGEHIYHIGHVNNKNKPDPALYLHAAQKLNVHPTTCIAIEDSAHGVHAAKCAGMYCIGINTSNKPEQLKDADCIINGYDEINLENLLGTPAPVTHQS